MVTAISVRGNGPTIAREKRDNIVHFLKMTYYSSHQRDGRETRKEKVYSMTHERSLVAKTYGNITKVLGSLGLWERN